MAELSYCQRKQLEFYAGCFCCLPSGEKTRMAYSLLMVANFANSVLLTLQVFGSDSLISFCIFVLNTTIVLAALYGIYNMKPIFIAPNVVFKITISSAALFYGLQLLESASPVPAVQLAWIIGSVVFFVLEVHAMFSASFGILKELSRRDRSKPPPSYDTVMSNDAQPPSYQEALARIHTDKPGSRSSPTKPVALDISSLEIHHIGQASSLRAPKSPSSPPPPPSSAKPSNLPVEVV